MVERLFMDDTPNGPRNILVLDDDIDLVRIVSIALGAVGYEVWQAFTVREALNSISKRGLPHLAVVDLLLPEDGGLAFCKSVHEYCDLPCIILSAVTDQTTIIDLIQNHAEDYITKPFHIAELVARVGRVLRRVGGFTYVGAPQIRVDNHLVVDFAHQHVLVDGTLVRLSPTETKILHILMGNAGRTVPAEVLLCRLWPGDEVFEETLRVNVHRLRQKIDPPDRGDHRHIITDRNVGYRFEAEP
jgi:DNA-binding response OmpR family regulator